jgi:hypothetical protein
MAGTALRAGTAVVAERALIGTAARTWRFGLCTVLCLAALSCGGGGSGGTAAPAGSSSSPVVANAANVASVVVDAGPAGTNDVNTLFTTMKLCVPGSTTSCQTIDHIQVDTASFGLRILSPVLTLSLPVTAAMNGDSLVECTQFVGAYSWGPVASADVQISGETANSVPVQIIGDPGFANVPAACSATGTAEDTVAAFGANGILGVGVFAQDCGSFCVSTVDNGNYYACSSTQCQPTAASLASQVPNPVSLFATDNNGVIIQLPSVAAQGAATVTGSLIFGIDTQTNNKSGSQTVLTLDSSANFTTVIAGQSLSLTQSFMDTGSNGLYFNDSSLAKCQPANVVDFYCPAGTQNLTAVLQGQSTVSANVSFSVGDAQTLGANDPSLVAFPTLAGPYPGTTPSFDWGLPFYFDRMVYTAMENATTSVGTGPYVAF